MKTTVTNDGKLIKGEMYISIKFMFYLTYDELCHSVCLFVNIIRR